MLSVCSSYTKQDGLSKRCDDKRRTSSSNKIPAADTFDLVEILKQTIHGKNILSSQTLSPSSRNKLVSLVINNELKNKPKSNITSQRFTQLAQYIIKLFPEENFETYYSLQRKATDGAQWSPKGKLYEKYKSIKKQTNKSGEKVSCPKNKSEIEAQASIDWLKSNSQPWSDVIEKWAKTTKYRLDQYCKSDCTIADYIESYPAFQEKMGYTLFEMDFKNLYPNKNLKLIDAIPSLSKKILLQANKSNDEVIRKYLDLVKAGGSEGIEETICFLVLPYLLSPPIISTGFTKKKKWRPSKQESQQNFLLHVTTKEELKTALERRQKKCEEMQESCQPLPIIVGNIAASNLEAFIEVNNTLFNVENTLKCIDVCYKLFHCLNANYPPESIHVWHFMQKYVYDMTTIYDNDYSCVNSLISELDATSV